MTRIGKALVLSDLRLAAIRSWSWSMGFLAAFGLVGLYAVCDWISRGMPHG